MSKFIGLSKWVSVTVPLSFQEHTFLRRTHLSSLHTLEEIVYGKIGPKLNPPYAHDYDDHFKRLYAGYKKALPDVVTALKPFWPAIWKMTFPTFEDLWQWVHDRIHHIPGIGRVAIYDIALRIGWNMYPRIMPERYVYITSKGVEDAAIALGLGPYIVNDRIPVVYFDPITHGHTAMEIEDILCIFSSEIVKAKRFDMSWLKSIM